MPTTRLAWNILAALLLFFCAGCMERAVPGHAPTQTAPSISFTLQPTSAATVPATSTSTGLPAMPATRMASSTPAFQPVAEQTQPEAESPQPAAKQTQPAADFAQRTPTVAGTLDTLRQTPPTLMLHKSSQDFDSVAFLREFVQILQRENRHVVTYAMISAQPDITALEKDRLFILTIDDISLQAPIDPSIQAMIDILLEAGYPAVLGIVTEGKLADDDTVRQLKALAQAGWELAMHTDTHANLHQLEQVSVYGARLEIRVCGDKIFQSTGVRPITLVLPYGDMVADLKILYREQVTWAVGIVAGEKYRTTNHVYYVGRESPAGSAENTYRIMVDRFKIK